MNTSATSMHSTAVRDAPAPMTVAELARAAGVTPDVVRHYSRIGLLQPRRDRHNGYKLFTHRDLARLLFIRRAKHLGFTLADIRQILGDANQGRSPCPRVRQIIEHRIADNRRRLQEMLELQARMERALDEWRGLPDGAPDGDSVCYLIESMSEGDDNR